MRRPAQYKLLPQIRASLWWRRFNVFAPVKHCGGGLGIRLLWGGGGELPLGGVGAGQWLFRAEVRFDLQVKVTVFTAQKCLGDN